MGEGRPRQTRTAGILIHIIEPVIGPKNDKSMDSQIVETGAFNWSVQREDFVFIRAIDSVAGVKQYSIFIEVIDLLKV
jgi:hypothetical protein